MAIDSERLFEMVDRMPTFSQSVVRILELTADINASPKDLVRLVEHDPILTMRVLRLVNSAYFGLSRQVTSIKQGVVYIGVNSIRHLAISIAAIGALPRRNDAGFDMNEFWSHSLITATVAKLLALQRGIPKSEGTRFFIAGLLHDIGQVVFAQFVPKEYRPVLIRARETRGPLTEVEENAMGITHAEVGAVLAEYWKLPEEFVTAIRQHHTPSEVETIDTLNTVVYVASQVAKLQLEESRRVSAVETLPPYIVTWLGMPLEEVAGRLPGLADEIEHSRSFIRVPMEVVR